MIILTRSRWLPLDGIKKSLETFFIEKLGLKLGLEVSSKPWGFTLMPFWLILKGRLERIIWRSLIMKLSYGQLNPSTTG